MISGAGTPATVTVAGSLSPPAGQIAWPPSEPDTIAYQVTTAPALWAGISACQLPSPWSLPSTKARAPPSTVYHTLMPSTISTATAVNSMLVGISA